jgi:hypothetical protein
MIEVMTPAIIAARLGSGSESNGDTGWGSGAG